MKIKSSNKLIVYIASSYAAFCYTVWQSIFETQFGIDRCLPNIHMYFFRNVCRILEAAYLQCDAGVAMVSSHLLFNAVPE